MLKGKEMQYYDSIKSASAAMGVPVGLLKEAKAAGCPAFRGSRVYAADYREWAKQDRKPPGGATGALDEPQDTKEWWDKEKTRKMCRKLDLEYEQALGELVSKADIKTATQAAFAPICGALERHLDKVTYNAMCRDIRDALAKIAK